MSHPVSVDLRCPVCHESLAARPVRTCPTCETPLHADCEEYIGGCARFACTRAATPRGRLASLLAIWEEHRQIHETRQIARKTLLDIFWPVSAAREIAFFVRTVRIMRGTASAASGPGGADVRATVRDLRKAVASSKLSVAVSKPDLAVLWIERSIWCFLMAFLLLWQIGAQFDSIRIVHVFVVGSFQIIAAIMVAMEYAQLWSAWRLQELLGHSGRLMEIWSTELDELLALDAPRANEVLLLPGAAAGKAKAKP